MALLQALLAHPGLYVGGGDGLESGPFTARIAVVPLVDGCGVDLRYEAWDDLEGLKHRERTTVAVDMASGIECLHVVCAELPGLAQLPARRSGIFGNGVGEEGFSIEIEATLEAEVLTYAWSWAPPGQPLQEQSRAVVQRVTGLS